MTPPPVHVVVPVRDQLAHTRRLLDQLDGECHDRLWVFDNGSVDGTTDWLASLDDPRVTVIERPGAGIYSMWNEGWLAALNATAGGPVAVAVLNNDIRFAPGTLTTLRDALYVDRQRWAVYPDWRRPVAAGRADDGTVTPTEGTFQHGGMSGWCFMIRGEAHLAGLPMIDEGYEWWYGDDDLAASIIEAGRLVCRVDGLPLDHTGEATATAHPWVEAAKVRDAGRWERRIGGSPAPMSSGRRLPATTPARSPWPSWSGR